MFLGHLGIAELAKGARREIPFALLIVAAYLPDLVRAPMDAIAIRNDVFSHSIPVVIILALVIGTAWKVRGGSWAAASLVGIVCLLHWPADVFTGCKPTFVGGPWIGFVHYRHPVSDLLVEGGLFLAGCWYARRRGFNIRPPWIMAGLAMQVGFLLFTYWGSEFIIGQREWTWKPYETWLPRRQALESTPCRDPDETKTTASRHALSFIIRS